MADNTDAVYNGTRAALADSINEALLQLGNTRSQANLLLDSVDDVVLPQPPEAATGGGAPIPVPPEVAVPGSVTFAPESPQVKQKPFPAAPADPRVNSWGGPRRPNEPNQFKQFFTGTLDTPDEVVSRANDAVSAWVDAYFPAVNQCFKDTPEDWVCGVVAGIRPLGNSEEAIDVAWAKAKANEQAQLASERSSIVSDFASRGFTLPPGVMLAQLRRAQERVSDVAAGVNREAALADVGVQAELLKLAVSVASDLKRGLAANMAQFFNTVASVQNQSAATNTERARIVADAESKFVTALTSYEAINQDYFKAREQLGLEGGKSRIDAYTAKVSAAAEENRAAIQTAQFKLDSSRQRLDALIAEVESGNARAQTQADVYRAQTQAYGTAVTAEVAKAQLEVSKYEAEVKALVDKAGLRSSTGAGTALSGVARAFGDIAAAAANASGTLVAQIEAF